MQFSQIEWSATNIAVLWLSVGFAHWAIYVSFMDGKKLSKNEKTFMLFASLILGFLILFIEVWFVLRHKRFAIWIKESNTDTQFQEVWRFYARDEKVALRIFANDYILTAKFASYDLKLYRVPLFGRQKFIVDNKEEEMAV